MIPASGETRFRIIKKWALKPERILNLKRERLHAPEKLPDLEKMLDEYYLIRGWDQNGIPQKEKLSNLGLENI